MQLEKILNAKVLIALNVLIIAVTELTGSLFMDYGIIHFIALIFLFLGISRIFVHYDSFDQYLRPLTFGAVLALLIFAFSHLNEYYQFTVHADYSDELYVHVTNLYMVATLLVATAAQYFLYKRDKSTLIMGASVAALLASVVVTVLAFTGTFSISLEPDEADIYIYSALVMIVTLYCINRLYTIGRAVSIMKEFARYLMVGFVLIAASALHYLLYEVLEHAGVPKMQVVYIGHFVFYAALSYIFLAFPKLAQLGGLYPKQ